MVSGFDHLWDLEILLRSSVGRDCSQSKAKQNKTPAGFEPAVSRHDISRLCPFGPRGCRLLVVFDQSKAKDKVYPFHLMVSWSYGLMVPSLRPSIPHPCMHASMHACMRNTKINTSKQFTLLFLVVIDNPFNTTRATTAATHQGLLSVGRSIQTVLNGTTKQQTNSLFVFFNARRVALGYLSWFQSIGVSFASESDLLIFKTRTPWAVRDVEDALYCTVLYCTRH